MQGQVLSWSDLGRSLGIADQTVRRHLEGLVQTYMVRLLKPWHENLAKRQVKSPKAYVRDSGVLHALLGIETEAGLQGHPVAGASWEGFALESVIRQLGARDQECFFWATHQGTELDLLVVHGTRRLGFEFKLSSAPSAGKSMHLSRTELKLDSLDVVYPGEHTFALAEGIRAVGLRNLTRDVKPL